ncbi:DUF2946 family protein [Sphingomonas sp. ac-8]|uniref:DUF2946 family protein n=1 Tax=Sphingomonas sp. ac-8 TaxID=3242977 RepID=UPI003A803715
MTALRRHLLAHRRLAAWLVAAALLMRMLIPTGYMLAATPGGGVTIQLCSGYVPAAPMAMHAGDHGASHDGNDKQGHDSKEIPCAFAGVATAALAATDALLLAAALFFILAAAFRLPIRLPAATPSFLRPPLRGPPATA